MRHASFLNKKILIHPEGDVVCDNILKNIPVEEHLVHFFNELIKPTDIIIEGGVYVGIHTVRFSELAYEGHIYSFEASKRNYDLAYNTIIDNNINNVTLVNKALFSDNAYIYLEESFTPDQDSVTVIPTNQKIEAVTIDSLDLPKVDFIKLDIEGGEAAALVGAINTIKKFHPIITFEYLKHLNHNSPIPFLIEQGYDVFQIDDHWDYVALPKK
jgi:FkbM family methyltransferase